MAEGRKKILIEVKFQEVGSDGVSKSAAKAAVDLSNLTEAEKRQRIEAEKLKITNDAVTASLRQQAAAELATANATGQLRAQSGLNNAILLETSRLASDAGYGFTAIANNLSQVISLFFSFSKTAGGTLNSIKVLIKSLLGSGGLLIAVQLLIAFGPKLLNWFKGTSEAAEKLKKDIDSLNESLRDSLSSYRNIIQDGSVFTKNQKELDRVVKALTIRFSEFQNGMENLKDKGLDGNREAIIELVKSFGELNRVRQAINDTEATIQNMDEKGIVLGRERQVIQEEYIRLLHKLDELEQKFTRTKGKGRESTETYKREFLRFTEEISRARQTLIKSLIQDKQDEIALVGETEKQKLQIEFNSFIERQKQRLIDQAITNKQYRDSEIQAAEELDRAIIAIDNKTRALRSQNAIDDLAKANEISRKEFNQRTRNEFILSQTTEEIAGKRAGNILKFDLNQLQNEISYNKKRLNDATLTASQRAEIEASITNMEAKESDIRLRIATNEMEGKIKLYEVTGSALQAFSNLVGEQTAVGKALAVSSTIVSTYAAAQRAYESQFLPFPDKTSPIRAEIARASAIAVGLANIKGILSEKMPGGGSAKNQIQVEAPDFNVVGASPESQLAQSVAGQMAKPIKAFVVGKEITSQQELDRNILTNAGLGD